MNKPMRLYLSLATLLILALLNSTACNKKEGSGSRVGGETQLPQASSTQATPPADGVKRVSISELQDALDKGEAVVVDVRGSVEYNLGHIKGSLSVPLGLIGQHLNDLPRDKLIVTYCA